VNGCGSGSAVCHHMHITGLPHSHMYTHPAVTDPISDPKFVCGYVSPFKWVQICHSHLSHGVVTCTSRVFATITCTVWHTPTRHLGTALYAQSLYDAVGRPWREHCLIRLVRVVYATTGVFPGTHHSLAFTLHVIMAMVGFRLWLSPH
jgi:hypothetical protein